MSIPGIRSGLIAGAVFVAAATMTAATGAAQAAACADLIAAFDKAVATRQVDAAVSGLTAIGGNGDPACLGHLKDFRVRLADFLLAQANAPGLAAADRDHAVKAADATLLTGSYWQGKARLADYYFAHGDKPTAQLWYKRSIAALAVAGAAPATDKQLKELMARAGAAKSLANDETPANKDRGFIAERGDDGSLGGIYSRALLRVRATAVVSVPVPINFEYNQTVFTPLGEEALKELIDAAREVPAMTLVGHADPRGSAAYNMELSKGRVMAVRDALIKAGVKTPDEITVLWKGATEPFDVTLLPDAETLSQQDIWQLDRRVEWLRSAERP